MTKKDYIIKGVEPPSNYLMHYGVKGMKWGVWNEETTDRYSGLSGRKLQLNEEGHNGNLSAIEKYFGVGRDKLQFKSSTGYDSPKLELDDDGQLKGRDAGYYEAVYKYMTKNKKDNYAFIVCGNARTGKIEDIKFGMP